MDRTPVNSSAIASVGYADGVLEIEFKSGQVHQYDASREEYEAMLAADSPGRFFHVHFRNRAAR